jgi:D-alanine transaminase
MFADGVYEVIRSYEGKLFRLEEHLCRLKQSLAAVRIDLADLSTVGSIARALIEKNDLQAGDATVYVQITRGVCARAHAFPPEPVMPTVYLEAARLGPRTDDLERGVAVITLADSRWGRCDIKSIGLLPNVLACQLAVEHGVAEAIFVRDGTVTEGTHTNVFGVRERTVVTYPRTNRVLPGITREIVLELCPALHIPVSESGILERQLARLDELFLAGTTVEVMPVVNVNGTAVGAGRPGPITRRLQAAFREYIASWRSAGGASNESRSEQS